MDDAQTTAALAARIERLEEIARQQSIAMISIWGITGTVRREKTSESEKRLFDELQDSLDKIVSLFGASDGRRD